MKIYFDFINKNVNFESIVLATLPIRIAHHGESFHFWGNMNFNKKAKTISEQIQTLIERGLIIDDLKYAEKILSSVSYYRLRAYWLTFEEISEQSDTHNFKENTKFEQIVSTYEFDSKLRHIVFKAIERIEIALRTRLIYNITLATNDNIWYANENNFTSKTFFEKFIKIFENEYHNSHEVFIKHYKQKYSYPQLPPSWMALEILSFGQLSSLYKNLKLTQSKKEIAKEFQVPVRLLDSWFESLAFVRNVCAHYGRLRNKKLPKSPIYPNRINVDWLNIEPKDDKKNRIYVLLAIISLLQNNFEYNIEFKNNLKTLLQVYPTLPLHYAGFPKDWLEDKYWQT